METSEGVDGNIDDLLSLLGGADGSSSLTTSLGDLSDDGLGSVLGHVVDDDVGTELGIHERVGASKTSTSSGDDNGLVVESNGVGLGVGGDELGALEVFLRSKASVHVRESVRGRRTR